MAAPHTKLDKVRLAFTIEDVVETGNGNSIPGQPSVTTDGFKQKPGCTLKVYEWLNGKVRPTKDVPNENNVLRASTVYFKEPKSLIYAVPFDVRQQSVAEFGSTNGHWSCVDGFDYQLHGKPMLKLKVGSGGRPNLPENCNCSWSQMFSSTYQPMPDKSCRVEEVKGLFGSLATILALAALSCPYKYQSSVLQASMGVDERGRMWRRHEYQGFKEERCVIVKVYGPQSTNLETFMQALENGRYGPLFDHR